MAHEAAEAGEGDHAGLADAQSSEEQEQSAMPFSYEDMLALGDLAGKVSKGLEAEALSRLRCVRVSSLRGEPGIVSLDRYVSKAEHYPHTM